MSGTSPEPAAGRAYTIRAGTPADADAILDLHRRSIRGLGPGYYTDAEVESWAHGLVAERYASAISDKEEQFLLAIDAGGGVIGFCSFCDDVVKGLYVHPDAARMGIGSALLQRAEAEIAAAGHAAIRVQASLSGQPFYAARGYAVTEEHGWPSRGGLTIAVAEMTKRLA